jgi:hypothetical protein
MRDSGVVYQDVEVLFLRYFVEYNFHVVPLGHVAAIGFRVSPGSGDFVDYRLSGVLVDVQHADAGTTTRKSLRNRAPNSASPSRDYGKFAVEAKSG